ncbi:MAG: helicase C-terminal domain-containing protein [Bacteroidota bacterium]
MSNAREVTKLKQISSLFKKHDLILAFDSSLITLYYLDAIAKFEERTYITHVVTGGNHKSKSKVIKIFELGSKEKKHVALCSDAMSEGVNLQQASAIVLLDMPSVLRIAEQRIGRLDRMDSPHDEIKAYWPKDSQEFSLKADKRLIRVSFIADYLIGSNLELPDELVDQVEEETIQAEEFIKEFEEFRNQDENWDGINDSFEPIRNLIYGSDPIIDESTFNYYKKIDETVNCKVSILESTQNFGFFSFRGTESKAPKWVFIDNKNLITSDLFEICKELRDVLPSSIKSDWNDDSKYLMKSYLRMIEAQEVSLLPHKKKRALRLLEKLVSFYKKNSLEDKERLEVVNALEKRLSPNIFDNQIIDYSLWLDQFIIMIQPDLNDLRERSRYNNPKDISDLLRFYKKEKVFSTEQLKKLLLNIPYISKPSERVAACIIGVGKSQNEDLVDKQLGAK